MGVSLASGPVSRVQVKTGARFGRRCFQAAILPAGSRGRCLLGRNWGLEGQQVDQDLLPTDRRCLLHTGKKPQA